MTLPNPGGSYLFYLGVGSPNDNVMTARDFVLEAEELASCPAGTSPPSAWVVSDSGPGCDCDCPDGQPPVHSAHVTDAMTGASFSDLNTDFWEPWTGDPGSTGEVTIDGDGVTFDGHLSYLGLTSTTGGPLSKWMLRGDFRIEIFLAQGDAGTRRNHATVAAATDCSTWASGLAGVWEARAARSARPRTTTRCPLEAPPTTCS